MTEASFSRPSRRVIAEVLALGLILGLAAYLRLWNVETNPGWYSDEGTDINIASNLLRGRVQYMALGQSTLLVARMPLFPFLLAASFGLLGEGIGTLRYLTGGLGTLSVGLLYLLVRVVRGRDDVPLALLAALMYAIYPNAVIFSRLGFGYNMLTPIVLLMAASLWKYFQTGRRLWLIMTTLLVGIGMWSMLMMLAFIPVLLILVSSRRWRDLPWCMAFLVLPVTGYVAFMWTQGPEAFLFDARFTLSRLSAVPLIAQPAIIALNFGRILARDYWFAPGLVGLFLLQWVVWRRYALLLLLAPLIALARTTSGLSSLGFYYLIPIFPFVALGVASLVRYGTANVLEVATDGVSAMYAGWGWAPRRQMGTWIQIRLRVLVGAFALFLVVVAPFLESTMFQMGQVWVKYEAAQALPGSGMLLVAPVDAERVALYVNEHVDSDDLVIASPGVAWLLHAHVADFQQSLAATGVATEHFPANMPTDRFVYDARYGRARYVIIDPVWRNWAVRVMPAVAAMVREVEQWPLVLRAGEIEVYQNPAVQGP